MPLSSPCIEFNSVSPTGLKMGLMESNGLKMLQRGLIKERIKGLIKERIIKSKGFLSDLL
ncbi:hypothetical protein KVK33_07535 [Helicobacter pylori]|nr:hypothetical protein KVK33_05015 [Helicobacter pylori]WQX47793.1 hypothetical protein KVK33_07535 [Helicobacter pylori]